MSNPADLIERLRTRAAIRRKIPRGEPDRIADVLEEAADMIERLTASVDAQDSIEAK